MSRVLLFLLHLILILSVVFLEQKNTADAILWVTVLICLPGLGAVLYLVFGNTLHMRLVRHFRHKRLGSAPPAPAVPAMQPEMFSEADRAVIRFNHAYSHSPLVRCSRPQILTDGRSHYAALFADLRAARHSICLEFYTIHNDRVGKALAQVLAEQAARGVKVQVLMDSIANLGTPASLFRPLQEAGGRVLRLKPYLTHYRGHRKIVVIDGAIGYIGGMNIGEKYLGLAPRKTPWRDTQLRLQGEGVAVLHAYFRQDWLCALPAREFARLGNAAAAPSPVPVSGDSFCQFVAGGADTPGERIKMCYLSLIRSARRSICIQSPYFIPDPSVLDALQTAAASGVHIRLMIPGVSSSFYLEPLTLYFAGQLLDYGAEVYRYQGYLHAKTMLIDDEICCIGSVNLDERSLRVDDEICGLFYDNAFVAEYAACFARDVADSTPYTAAQHAARSPLTRMWERLLLLFAPLM